MNARTNKRRKEKKKKNEEKKKNERAGLSCAMSLSSIFGEHGFCCPVGAWPQTPTTTRPKRGATPLLRIQPAPEWSAAGRQDVGDGEEQTEPRGHCSPPLTSSSQSCTHTHARTHKRSHLMWILWACGSSVFLCVIGLYGLASMTVTMRWPMRHIMKYANS